jgi:uncharacterized membrane protein YecN with MAPEG domain
MIEVPMTLATAGACGLLFLVLSWRVVQARVSEKVAMGDGGSDLLITRMRTHANFTEYVPLILVMMGFLEATGANRVAISIMGVALVAVRIAHAIGMPLPAPNPFRFVGTLGSWLILAVASLYAIVHAFIG